MASLGTTHVVAKMSLKYTTYMNVAEQLITASLNGTTHVVELARKAFLNGTTHETEQPKMVSLNGKIVEWTKIKLLIITVIIVKPNTPDFPKSVPLNSKRHIIVKTNTPDVPKSFPLNTETMQLIPPTGQVSTCTTSGRLMIVISNSPEVEEWQTSSLTFKETPYLLFPKQPIAALRA